MSMNLVWTTQNGKAYLDFEFQTPTDLTYSVLNETNKEKQYSLLKDYMEKRYDFEEDREYYDSKLKSIREKLFDTDFKLSMV